MRLDKQRVAGKRELYDAMPFVVIKDIIYNGVTHPSIEYIEKTTWERPDCNSQR